jgi:uncharacterized protein YfaS (alpha-2-macroglobulin family)
VPEVKPVKIDQVLSDRKGHGAAAFGVRWTTPRTRSWTPEDVRIVSLTDLAITAKMSRFGSVVWVNRLSDGKPVAGGWVAIRDEQGREVFVTKADERGIALVPADKYTPVNEGRIDNGFVFARSGDDWAYRPVAEMLPSWRYAPSSDPAGWLTGQGMLFTDRGVYRPGETVRVKGLFRVPLPRGTETPRGREVNVEAYDSNETKIIEQKLPVGTFGEFAIDVPVPASARLGTMQIRAELAGKASGRSGTCGATVLLAAYKPAEFKVTVDPDKASYVRGDKASFVSRGDYLFGAPMGGGKVRYTVSRGVGWFTPPGAEGLVTSDEEFAYALTDASPRAGVFQSGDGALDAKGSFASASLLAMPNQRGVEVVSVEAEVEDVSRQTIAGRASAIVHPGEFYVALKPPKEMFVEKGVNLRPEVAAIEPGGKRRSTNVHVVLIRRSWHTVVEESGESGGHYESKPVDTTIASCDAATIAGGYSQTPGGPTLSACDLVVPERGFFIVRATAKDPRGNVVAASTAIYALGAGSGPRTPSGSRPSDDDAELGWAMEDASTVELVRDKKTYEVGDTAKILVKNPFREAEALVTVERAGVYTESKVLLSGPMPTISVPITDDLRPNAYVSVHVVRGRTAPVPPKGADIGAPAFRLGYTELVVNPEARRLKVAIAPTKKELRPSEEVDVDLAVSDRAAKGVRADVTFYAVDEGVLMLTGYKTPDPIPTFTAPRALAVWSLESREDLAKILSFVGALGSDKGGEGGGGGGSVREDFRATAYFLPSVVTGANGKAHVHFKLPDSLTTYRLMAVAAAEDDRFGFGEAQIVTSRPLMARPAMPRFLRAGDSIEAGVVVSSKGIAAQSVEVTLAAEGANVSGEAKKTISLPANGNVEVRWPIVAASSGKATFAFKARALPPQSGGTNVGAVGSDELKITREVEVPLASEAVALYGETTEATGEKIGDLGLMRSDTGGLDVRVSSSALVGLDDGVEQLIEYPYGCTEQLTSRLVPLIPLRALANDYGLKLPADLSPVIEKTIAKILQNQRPDGGFGWWPDSRYSDPWLTAYALWGLEVAKKNGVFVPSEAIDSAVRHARRELARMRLDHEIDLATAAFVVDVLATTGTPDTGYTSTLFEKREKMPLFARALLAHAMVLSKMSAEDARKLTLDFENHLRVSPVGATVAENAGDAYAPLMDSEARTTAMVIRALVATEPKHPLAARLAKGLLAMRKHGTWRSTQETAWSLLALDDYRRAQESAPPDFDALVFLGDDQLLTAPFHGRTVGAKTATTNAQQLFSSGAGGASLAFQVKGKGKLFYEARLRYAKKEMPREGLDRGFFVRKLMRSVKPEAFADALATLPRESATSALGGDLVLVDLLVTTPDPREQVVIDDPLPAGLEPVQTNLETTARSHDVDRADDQSQNDDDRDRDDDRANGHAYTFAWYHREMHDDRVLTFVEHMPAGLFHYRYLARATTHGKFVVPPTRAECMYEPETFGRTGAATFEVKVK